MSLAQFIQEHVTRVEPLEKTSKLAFWNLATTGDSQYAKTWQDTETAIRTIYSSAEEYRFLLRQQEQTDPLLARQAKLLLNKYLENQMPSDILEETVKLETEIESIYTNFRTNIDGKFLSNNELKEIFLHSIDSNQRKKAWEASKQIGNEVSEKVLRLVDLRNQAALQAGFSNYYSMMLTLQELDEQQLFRLLTQLEQITNTYWKRYNEKLDQELSQKFGVSASELKPWHYQDPFFQEAPQQQVSLDPFYAGQDIVGISCNYFDSIDLPVSDILERSDLFERQGKNQHAFCLCLDRKEDVRILCNIRDNEGWMGTQLHELGHAVYDKWLDPSLPFLLRIPAHICMTESIAQLFGKLSTVECFLQKYGSAAEPLPAQLSTHSAAQLLVFARWTLVMIHFERDLYQKKQINLNDLWWSLVARFQGVRKVSGRNAPDWASKLHLACAPVYYQNYILGEMISSQLKQYLQKNQINLMSGSAGKWLKTQFFASGASFQWETTLKKATQENLNPEYFSHDIRGAI
jgi:peptidyl-dipeptidase A